MREATFGEKAVGLTFNPSGDKDVNDIKYLYAQIIDRMETIRLNSPAARALLAAISITEAQGAQILAVKAITWKE